MIWAPAGVSAPKPAAIGYRARKVRCALSVAAVAGIGAATLYDVLGLRAGATVREIKAAYRRLARERHPDVAGAPAAGDFIRLHDAYATLSDPDSRARYDRDNVVAMERAPPGPPLWYNACRTRRRTWETDQCW
ncbi:hypothetical protein GUJ93_ZPchr0008g11562 [Zizania palustris]|uniref:J domain-containing protein n=1 Tax=Zizania palustris TaxID=103762 RepID=A0A8J5R0R2_ZIZPA|nr:hypothetical protein GUJ93_ZPchr0008g11562 [Zizania palustris]